MQQVNGYLFQKMKQQIQIGDNAPNMLIELRNTRDKNKPPYVIKKVITIDVDRKVGTGASECNISFSNFEGLLSPDYDVNKFPEIDLKASGYQKVLWPYNMVIVYFGYGEHLVKRFTGFIDKVFISASRNTIELTARDTWGKITDAIIEPLQDAATNTYSYLLEYKNMYVTAIIADLVSKAIYDPTDYFNPYCIIDNMLDSVTIYSGKNLSSTEIVVVPKHGAYTILEIEKDWTKVQYFEHIGYIYNEYTLNDELSIDYISFDLGAGYEDAISSLLAAINFVGFATKDGNIRCMREPFYTNDDEAHHEFKDYINITDNSYNHDSSIVRNKLIIEARDRTEAFKSKYLMGITNNFEKTAKINAPWALTPVMKVAIAKNFFGQIMRKIRRMTTAVIGNPSMDLFDLVQYYELVSTARMKYKIISIKTTFSDQGYFDFVDVEFVDLDPSSDVEKLLNTYVYHETLEIDPVESFLDGESKSFYFDLPANKPVTGFSLHLVNRQDGLSKTTFHINLDNTYTTGFVLEPWDIESMDQEWASDLDNIAKIKSYFSNGIIVTSFRNLIKVNNKFELILENLARYIFPQYQDITETVIEIDPETGEQTETEVVIGQELLPGPILNTEFTLRLDVT